jgi:hypothetical protein
MNRLSDDDVDRIARRIVGKLVVYGLVIVAAVWLAPIALFALMNFVLSATSGMPAAVRISLAAAVMAGPVVLIIWAWGRSKRAR